MKSMAHVQKPVIQSVFFWLSSKKLPTLSSTKTLPASNNVTKSQSKNSDKNLTSTSSARLCLLAEKYNLHLTRKPPNLSIHSDTREIYEKF